MQKVGVFHDLLARHILVHDYLALVGRALQVVGPLDELLGTARQVLHYLLTFMSMTFMVY